MRWFYLQSRRIIFGKKSNMKTITFISSEKKIHQLVQLAKVIGVKTKPFRELRDEEMGLPGPKVSKTQLEHWLAKDDGESFTEEEAFTYMKKELAKTRGKQLKHGSKL